MIELHILAIGLIALVGALCTAIYSRFNLLMNQISKHQYNLDRFEARLNDQMLMQERIKQRLDQLATDVLQREIYKNADDRHQQAIQDAKRGCSLSELIEHHGLSSDEASLILSLHTSETSRVSRSIEASNANLRKLATVGNV